MSDPLISVIVPVYGVEKYLRKCVDSILAQTYSKLEVILVDDGSPDNCGKICDEYADKDSRVKVIHKENGGQGTARNKGLDICSGEYISFLDSDDSMEPDCIANLYRAMIESSLDISSCNCAIYNENGDFIKYFETTHDDFITDGIEAQKMIWYAECINLSPWGKLFRREDWKNVRFKECRFYEDYATMHLIYLKAKRFGYLKYAGIRYLVRSNSDIRSFNDLKLLTLDIADDTIEYAEKNCPDVLSAATAKAVSLYFHIYMNMPSDKKYSEWHKRINRFINKHRFAVLSDKRARKKTKMALIISLMGNRFTRKIYKYKKSKNILF